MSRFLIWFVKITGFPPYFFHYRRKLYFENDNKSLRRIKGSALIVSNHNSVWDFPLIMFTFPWRSLRTLVAEVVFEMSSFMGHFMQAIGAIIVDRKSFDFSFMQKAVNCLEKGQVVLVFPEAHVPDTEEEKELLAFKPSYVYIALESGAPIIPVYTNGIYGKKLRREKHDTAKIIVGERIYPQMLLDSDKTEKENIDYINNYVRDCIKKLRKDLESRE